MGRAEQKRDIAELYRDLGDDQTPFWVRQRIEIIIQRYERQLAGLLAMMEHPDGYRDYSGTLLMGPDGKMIRDSYANWCDRTLAKAEEIGAKL